MKHICSFYVALIFSLTAQVAWGQTPDTTAQRVDSTRFRTVVSDRINEADEPERGPSVNKLMKKADDSYGKKNFYASMKYYGFVLKAENLHVEALKGYGESALAISSLDIADSAFQRMVDHGISPSPDYFPKMRLAEVKFRKGRYQEAMDLYNEIANLPQTPPVPDALKRSAAERMDLCLWAQAGGLDNPYVIKGDTCYLIDTANVNTRELYSEYVANIQDGQLYFSAYRFDFKKDRANPKRNTIKLLKAEDARQPLRSDLEMAVTESEFNDLKRQHTAHLTFSTTGDAYYALGDYVRDSADIRFELYRRKKQPEGWGLPEKLNGVNLAGYTHTEPSLGLLPGAGHETLFFVSDRPGGKGGRDIWFSNLLGDSLSAPKPLAEVNTPGDDVSPFYHNGSNTLFFSSDSLKSLGGFDVYKTRPLPGGHWRTPDHMGAPINSAANDVFFVMDKGSERGFFSSNRIGNTNYSEEGCCYDIYMVDFLTRYRAIALHDITHKPLSYTRISLFEVGANGKLTPYANPPADTTSSYPFKIKVNQEYAVVGEKAGFTPDTVYRKPFEELWTSEIVDTLYLRPKVNLIASVYDAETGEPIYGATTTFFDLGFQNKLGNFLSSKGEGKVDVLPATTNSNNYKIDFEHKYRVLAAKEGYVSDISKADSSEVISTIGRVDGGTMEVKLYLHRPSVLETYLPITLYFDNDYPKRIRSTDSLLVISKDPYLQKMRADLAKDPRDPTYQDTILLDYQKTFVGYMRQKETYIKEFANGLKGHDRQAAIDTIENFFEKEVRMNWDSFFALSDKIDLMLQNGDTIILTLKGYASPLSNPDYNFHLTNRRIASVYNHFMIFDGGIFKKYREIVGNGQLRFVREANGDTESVKKGVNKDPSNRRLSIYDVHASRERRVQIIGAKVSKGSNSKKRI